MKSYKIIQGDNLEAMREMPDNSVDSIVTDPPYGLSFMGKKWDYDVPSIDTWRECLRVLKPGGHLLAFAGTRTQHRMAVRIEDAGFEIRDMIAWVYGCLSEDTEVMTSDGPKHYTKTKAGDLVLCYDPESGAYSYQPILEVVEYDYRDTAYRLVGDFGEQIVSRNHRVLVELDGRETFQLAETLEREARVPILEDVPSLQSLLYRDDSGAGCEEQDLRQGLRVDANFGGPSEDEATGREKGLDGGLRCLREKGLEAKRMAIKDQGSDMQLCVQRHPAWEGLGEARAQGTGGVDCGVGGRSCAQNDRREQPELERGGDLPEQEGGVFKPTDQVREMSDRVLGDGEKGWVRNGAPNPCRTSEGQDADKGGVCTPHQPRRDGQPVGKPDAFSDERGAQEVRAWAGHKTHLVRVVPFHYTGKVWCLRVPTGCFVAYRDGVAFPTGNSGFPKSHNVSKAIDKAAGAERGTAYKPRGDNGIYGKTKGKAAGVDRTPGAILHEPAVTEPAKRWDGWGTALKPALEPITVARKPFKGTVADNVLEHGTGALNIDGCRVSGSDTTTRSNVASSSYMTGTIGLPQPQQEPYTTGSPLGRWPANLIHDGSGEVLALFPGTASGESAARYFYCAKASKRDRDEGLEAFREAAGHERAERKEGSAGASAYAGTRSPARNTHPTVKPTQLMRYLCRLVTPPGGVVLDPFCGSGSTGKAAVLEGFQFVGLELDPAYVEIAEARCEWAASNPDIPKAPAEDPHTPSAQSEPAEPDRGQQNLFIK